jgi:hypothetical protein
MYGYLGRVLGVLLLVTLPSLAAVRGDVKVLEATETIRYRVNDLTKNYLLYFRFPHKFVFRKKIETDLQQLSKSLQIIAMTTKDSKTKNLLAYFAYEKARIEEILEKKPDADSLAEILAISEGFVEGADAIARHHAYDFNFEEKMFMQTRSMEQRLEEILKYYIAVQVIKNDSQLLKKMNQAMEDFRKKLKLINEYRYDDVATEEARKRLNKTWSVAEKYFVAVKEKSLPLVLNVGAGRIETILAEIGIYHSKNQ